MNYAIGFTLGALLVHKGLQLYKANKTLDNSRTTPEEIIEYFDTEEYRSLDPDHLEEDMKLFGIRPGDTTFVYGPQEEDTHEHFDPLSWHNGPNIPVEEYEGAYRPRENSKSCVRCQNRWDTSSEIM